MHRTLSLLFVLVTLTASADQTLNTPRAFPNITSKLEWQNRAQSIREQLQISTGLWPMPEKTPLQPVITGKIIRDGYSIEKVYFQSLPGFYVGGNLYRPLGQGNGPFPGILSPHGHAAEGRLTEMTNFSTAARCINFAKQGMIAFSYDMVGYNDTHFPFPENFQPGPANSSKTHHAYATNKECLLWNINLMGLQTWDSIRALDFLETLPDVDKTRLACTGESGGGTQTYILGAIDDRLAAQAPVVMVSHLMQGGCLCENAPGLRLDFSNVEIATVPAPRPQLIVGASGDWTKDTLTMEGPSIQSVYRLFDKAGQFHFTRFDFPHNYNQTSREAVYQFFNETFLDKKGPVAEQPYKKEPDADLLVWPDHRLPENAVTDQQLINWLKERQRAQLAELKKSPEQYRRVLKPAWQHTLQLDLPERNLEAKFEKPQEFENCSSAKVTLSHSAKGDPVSAYICYPRKHTQRTMVILAHVDGPTPYRDTNGAPVALAKTLLARGFSVMLLAPNEATSKHEQVNLFYTTYNKTVAQQRVQELVTACAFARGSGKAPQSVAICGTGPAALWAIMAAPAVDSVIADCGQLDFNDDKTLLRPELFIPGIRALGGVEGLLALAGDRPIALHNTASAPHLDDEAIIKWLERRR